MATGWSGKSEVGDCRGLHSRLGSVRGCTFEVRGALSYKVAVGDNVLLRPILTTGPELYAGMQQSVMTLNKHVGVRVRYQI